MTIDLKAFLDSLMIILTGMLGIIIVMLVLYLVIVLLGKIKTAPKA